MWVDRISLELPEWLSEFASGVCCPSVEEKVGFAIQLADLNVSNGTGGPFGAAIFERATGRLIAPGVNLVVPSNCSIAHAEMTAIATAQQTLGNFDLSGTGCDLATSTEPCAMCLGAIPWSGVSAVYCGATDADAKRVGFDEGDKPEDWVQCLRDRGVNVEREILRERARAVLLAYEASGGSIYNAGASREDST